jgi:hypothetical protein
VKLQQGEQLIKQQDNAVWVRGTFNNAVGKLILTNRRLAFEQRSVIKSSILGQFGLVGALADEALPRNIVVNLPLELVASFAQVKVVSSRKVLPVITKNGQEFLFSGPKYEQWRPALLQAGLFDAGQPLSAPGMPAYGQPTYGQPSSQSQQLAYAGGYAPPQPQAASKTGIPWWGWLLIVVGIIIFACAALVIALAALGYAVGGATSSDMTDALGWSLRISRGLVVAGVPYRLV